MEVLSLRKVRKIESVLTRISIRKRVAAYARVSSKKDASLHSLSAQVSYYSEMIQSHTGWDYVGAYVDEAITGTENRRTEFQKLLSDSRAGKIDLIITKSISRFARNTLMLLEAVRELKDLGIDVFFEKENIHSMSGDGELMLTILASFAQEESRSASDNVKWRIRKRFAEGELVNLRFMFGYKIEKGTVEINAEEAGIVRLIFSEYVNGLGCTRIAKKLREMRVARPRGGRWDAERVAEILKNEKYTGNSLLQKKFVSDHLTKKLKPNKGELPQYFAEGTHPQIIDGVTYQKAQEIMSKRKERFQGNTKQGRYPFTSMIVCGNCGKKYKRKTSHGRVYWNCSTYLEFGKKACQVKQIPEKILKELAVEVLGATPFDGEYFLNSIKEIRVLEPSKLEFIFMDGHSVIKEWQNKTRSESWNEEDRERARQRGRIQGEGGI
ncbi:recombinase family protein [Clostridia bacterium]|nr:recombinase family protein [Clostridia bacterium]